MRPRSRQRGAAALFVTVLLCFAMILLVAFTHRNVAVEESRSANDYRAAAAFEAAEAGLEWMLARINDPTPLSAQCEPSGAPGALSLRDRLLRFDATGAIAAATWSDAGVATPLRTACLRTASGWTCSCPTHGRPLLAASTGPAMAPGFVVQLVASPRPGLVDIVATGCTRGAADGVCAAASESGHEASSRLAASWALVPALHALPAAALTVRGNVDAGALEAVNPDRAGNGLALHAGGRVVARALRLSTVPGSPLAGALASADASLADLTGAQLFARYFGMDMAAWSQQPAVHRIACASECSGAIAAAIAAGRRLLYVDGDLTLAGPATFGSIEQPIALVAAGALRFSGDVALHGVVHGSSLTWRDTSPAGALVRGAALVAGDYGGDAATSFVHDGAVLDRLRRGAGSFVRINGSWKDF